MSIFPISHSFSASPLPSEEFETRSTCLYSFFQEIVRTEMSRFPAPILSLVIPSNPIVTPLGLDTILQNLLTRKAASGTLSMEQGSKNQVFTSVQEFCRQSQALKSGDRLIGIIKLTNSPYPDHYTTCIAFQSPKGLMFLQSDSTDHPACRLPLKREIQEYTGNTRFFYFTKRRQKDEHSCWVFSLRDALYFASLSNEALSRFFSDQEKLDVHPAKLMRACQSITQIQQYEKSYPGEFKEADLQSLNKNFFGQKNCYIFYKTIKYLSFLAETAHALPEEQTLLHLLHPKYDVSDEEILSAFHAFQDHAQTRRALIQLSQIQSVLKATQDPFLPDLFRLYQFALLNTDSKKISAFLSTLPFETLLTRTCQLWEDYKKNPFFQEEISSQGFQRIFSLMENEIANRRLTDQEALSSIENLQNSESTRNPLINLSLCRAFLRSADELLSPDVSHLYQLILLHTDLSKLSEFFTQLSFEELLEFSCVSIEDPALQESLSKCCQAVSSFAFSKINQHNLTEEEILSALQKFQCHEQIQSTLAQNTQVQDFLRNTAKEQSHLLPTVFQFHRLILLETSPRELSDFLKTLSFLDLIECSCIFSHNYMRNPFLLKQTTLPPYFASIETVIENEIASRPENAEIS